MLLVYFNCFVSSVVVSEVGGGEVDKTWDSLQAQLHDQLL